MGGTRAVVIIAPQLANGYIELRIKGIHPSPPMSPGEQESICLT